MNEYARTLLMEHLEYLETELTLARAGVQRARERATDGQRNVELLEERVAAIKEVLNDKRRD